jgi:NAD(P)-dependent dehydrogenase (short-subunit alcohol dehydrogenase family)
MESQFLMSTSLSGRVAIVTGSTSGIGRGVALRLAELGARVVVHGREEAGARETLDAVAKAGGAAAWYRADLARATECRKLIEFAAETFGALDILVNNAALTTRGDIEHASLEIVDTVLAVNLRAPLLLTQAAIPHMRARGGGTIVNIGSVNAYIGEPKLCVYSVSKGGLMTLTKNCASYLNRYRIRVNQINVGWTLTEGEDRVKRLEGKGDDWLDEASRSRPWGRLFSPADVANAVVFFASDESAMVTGSVMDLEQYPVGAPPNW